MVTRFVVSAMFLALVVIADASAATLTLKNTVYRGAVPLHVADLFEVTGQNATEISQFELKLEGKSGWQDTTFFARALSEAGFDVKFKGLKRVWLGLCKVIDLEAVANSVEAKVMAQLDEATAKISKLSLLGEKPPCLALEQSLATTEVSVDKPVARLASKHMLNDGKSLTLWWHIDYALRLPVALNSLNKNEKVSESSVEYRWLSAQQGAYQWPLTEAALVQRRATRQIATGEAIVRGNSEVVPVIEKGEVVTLILQDGAITIEAKAKALQSGQIAEVIQVLPTQGTGPVNGKISAKGVVYAAF